MAIGDGVDVYGIDNSKWWPIYAGTPCAEVQVIENPFGTSTTDYMVARQPTDANPVTIKAGIDYIFKPQAGRRYWTPGEIVGYAKTVSGSMNLARMDR